MSATRKYTFRGNSSRSMRLRKGSKRREGGRERDMATTNVVARNRLVAGALMGFVSLTYGYTMIRMKNTTASVMDEFANSPAKDAGK